MGSKGILFNKKFLGPTWRSFMDVGGRPLNQNFRIKEIQVLTLLSNIGPHG